MNNETKCTCNYKVPELEYMTEEMAEIQARVI